MRLEVDNQSVDRVKLIIVYPIAREIEMNLRVKRKEMIVRTLRIAMIRRGEIVSWKTKV